MSDIRVFVTFPESPNVFAGQTLQCKITFKNVSPASQHPGSRGIGATYPAGASLGPAPIIGAQHNGKQRGPPLQIPGSSRPGSVSPRPNSSRPPSAGHKPSYSQPTPTVRPKTATAPFSPTVLPPLSPNTPGHKHKRSISIVSLSSDAGIEPGVRGRNEGLRSPTTQPRRGGHGRSASVQTVSGRITGGGGGISGPTSPAAISARGNMPQTPPVDDIMSKFSFPARKSSGGSGAPPTPVSPRAGRSGRSPSLSKVSEGPSGLGIDHERSPGRTSNLRVNTDTQSPNRIDLKSPSDDSEYDNIASSRLIPAQSVNGTPRSSGEFYSMSNSTTETLISEYDPKNSRFSRNTHNRRHSLLSVGSRQVTDTLMMGYAQVMGSFTLDGSLVQSNIFEDVKRKGVVGTHSGGGVVGIETNKTDGGFLSGFGWGGFGGLLGGSNMSTIAEMKSSASGKSIPILSTPQSILFVDLRLSPGESRSYLYKFTLPKTLPPSHRGKAIKITYNLVLGTQRPGNGTIKPSVIEIPFRVFPYVAANGTLHTHDLLSPHILLRDEATTVCLDDPLLTPSPSRAAASKSSSSPNCSTANAAKPAPSSLKDFLTYVDDLLAPQSPSGHNISGHLGLLSPTYAPKRSSWLDEPPLSCSENIEMTLLAGLSGHHSSFEIARNSRKVATITLARPAYKLGETLIAVIDFTGAVIPCIHLHATLESSEEVEKSLALRSAASIQRGTRRVWYSQGMDTGFKRRVVFSATIPQGATPEFKTTGVGVRWGVRFEFITAVQQGGNAAQGNEGSLLELGYKDERAEFWEAKQMLAVESFDASVPVRVFGADMGREVGGASRGREEGWVV